MTLLFTDPIFLRHETGRHVEVPGRLRAITTLLEAHGLMRQCAVGSFRPLSPENILQVHEPQVVQRVRQLADQGGGLLDADTVVSRRIVSGGTGGCRRLCTCG